MRSKWCVKHHLGPFFPTRLPRSLHSAHLAARRMPHARTKSTERVSYSEPCWYPGAWGYEQPGVLPARRSGLPTASE